MTGKTVPLREIVDRYVAAAGGFGQPVALSAFGLERGETEKLFSALDEDYHISRFLKFTMEAAQAKNTFSINSFPQSHVSIDREIETIL
jgi:hypothetical protein